MRMSSIVGLVGTLLAAGTAHARTSTLTPYGLGPIKIGMTVETVSRIVHAPIDLSSDQDTDDPNGCASVPLPGQQGVSLLFENRKLTSIWVYAPSTITTEKAIGIGARDRAVTTVYPNAKVTDADYDEPPAENIIAWLMPDKAGLLFRTNTSQKVVSIAAGGHSIQYEEGCL